MFCVRREVCASSVYGALYRKGGTDFDGRLLSLLASAALALVASGGDDAVDQGDALLVRPVRHALFRQDAPLGHVLECCCCFRREWRWRLVVVVVEVMHR